MPTQLLWLCRFGIIIDNLLYSHAIIIKKREIELGSKNRIFLGMFTAIILHHIRNKYAKDIFMSKRVHVKIKQKHPDMLPFTCKEGFASLLENTIATVPYHKMEDADNFIVFIDGNYILYALKREKHHTSCSTIFKLKPSTLKRYYKDDRFKILQKSYEEDIKKYIMN